MDAQINTNEASSEKEKKSWTDINVSSTPILDSSDGQPGTSAP